MAEQLDRFRSFVERYVIARAGHFEVGREQEQAWMAIQDAKKVYGMVADAKNETDTAPETSGQFAGVAQAPAGAVGPSGMVGVQRRNAAKAAKAAGAAMGDRPWEYNVVAAPDAPDRSWIQKLVSSLRTN